MAAVVLIWNLVGWVDHLILTLICVWRSKRLRLAALQSHSRNCCNDDSRIRPNAAQRSIR